MSKTEISNIIPQSGSTRIYVETSSGSDIAVVTICPKDKDSVICRFYLSDSQLNLLLLGMKSR